MSPSFCCLGGGGKPTDPEGYQRKRQEQCEQGRLPGPGEDEGKHEQDQD